MAERPPPAPDPPAAPAGTSAPAVPLSEVPVGTRVRIESLPDHGGLRDRLLAMGIRPGVQLEVLRRGRPGGILHLANGLQEFMLRREHARQMAVTTAAPQPGCVADGTDGERVSPQGRP